ncbi:MAG TPA: phage tail tube protein [Gammaproteobacteria bacterium]|nr:phage tail tube protein [Gammaproteobacteria bacterium]
MAIVGIVKAFFGGTEIPLLAGSSFKRGGFVNKPVAVGASIQRARQYVESVATLKIGFGTGMSMDALLPRDTQAEFQFETDTGQTYTIQNAFVSETEEISDGGAGATATISGGEAVEITAS